MPTKLITAPTEPPVVRDDLAKVHLKIRAGNTSEDTLLDLYINSATEDVQDFIQRQLMQATYELQLSNWSAVKCGFLTLVKAPLVSVVSINYDDENEAEQTMPTDEYEVDTTCQPGRIRFIETLPNLADKLNCIRIRYVAGYGASGDNAATQRAAVPNRAKVGILRTVADFYENRQDQITGTTESKLTNSVEKYLTPLRLFIDPRDVV